MPREAGWSRELKRSCHERFAVENQGSRLFSVAPVSRMPSLMFDDIDSDSIRPDLSKINHIRKSRHQYTADVRINNHPASGVCRDTENQSFKLIGEFFSEARTSFFIKVTDFLKFSFDGGMILNDHRRSRDMTCSCETGCTLPLSSSRSRSRARLSAAESSKAIGAWKGSSRLSHNDSAKSARCAGGKRNASEASCSMLIRGTISENPFRGNFFSELVARNKKRNHRDTFSSLRERKLCSTVN